MLLIKDFYNIPIGTVKNSVSHVFEKEKYVFVMKTLFKVGIEAKKDTLCIRIQPITMAKTITTI